MLKRLALLLCLWPLAQPAWAWGPLGHKLVARLAQQRLKPATLRAIDALRAEASAQGMRVHETDRAYRFIDQDLGRFFTGQRLDLGLVASWADGWRSRDRRTEGWHFVDLDVGRELDARAVREACGQDDCVVAQVGLQQAVLADRGRPAQERIKALLLLIHLVADLHQPLHCATRQDHGGNRLQVLFFGRPQSLHQVWDHGVLERQRLGAAKLLRQLDGVREGDAYHWRSGRPLDWALESAALAREVAYGGLPAGPEPLRLERGYQARALPVVKLQLQKAGVRLAALLDESMGQ